jgi:hypothetical protein
MEAPNSVCFSADNREPNTAPIAECGLQTKGVSDRGRGREIDRGCTQAGRNGTRDGAAILLAYRHGLRAAELCQLRWAQIDLRQGRLHVNRLRAAALAFIRCTVQSFVHCDRCKDQGLTCS